MLRSDDFASIIQTNERSLEMPERVIEGLYEKNRGNALIIHNAVLRRLFDKFC